MENEKAMKILDRLDGYCDMGRPGSKARYKSYPNVVKKLQSYLKREWERAEEDNRRFTANDAVRAGMWIAFDYIRDTICDLKSEYGLIKTDYEKMEELNRLKNTIQPLPKNTAYEEERSPDDFESVDFDADGYVFKMGRGDEEEEESEV